MLHYPVFLNLSKSIVVLIGDGADSRVPHLEAAGATIRRVSPTEFTPETLDGASLVICATDDEPLNRRVSQAAEERRIFCNVLDRPALCSWIAPAVVRHGPLQVAISTGGKSPALSVRIKETIDQMLGPEYTELLDMLAALREQVQQVAPTYEARSKIFQSMARGPALDLLREGKRDEAAQVLKSLLM